MKQIELTVFERLQLAQYIGQTKGDLRHTRLAIRILDKLELNDVEREEVGLSTAPGQIAWMDGERLFPLEFEDDELAVLKSAVNYPEWPASQARQIVPMLEKLSD